MTKAQHKNTRAPMRSPLLDTSSDVAGHDVLMLGLMSSVTSFMLRTGMSTKQIGDIFQQSISGNQKTSRREVALANSSLSYGRDTIAGAVLRAWHRFPKYLNSAARPIPLRANGPDPSLGSLVLSQDRNADVSKVVRSMLDAGLVKVRKDRKYVPEKDLATVTTLDPLSVDHIAKTVIRLVETATGNTGNVRGKLKLIERYAHVPDLVRSEARAFASFSRQQGQAYLDAIEDWLEARQKRNRRGSVARGVGLNAGVHVFAFLADCSVSRSRKGRKKRAKRLS